MQLLRRSAAASLAGWKARPFSPGTELGPQPDERRDEYKLVVAREPPGAPQHDGPFRRAASAILRYDIFEPSTLTSVIERVPLQVGGTVGARYHLPFGLDLFFASRVIEVFDGPQAGVYRAGLTYRTLAGHPECGEETFSVEKDMASGDVMVALRSWSRPGLLITRVGWPIA